MRNNHPFLREPPYRRRETLIERLGFLFVQISRLSFLFPIGLAVSSGILIEDERTYRPDIKSPAIGFKQVSQAAGKD